MTRALTDTRVFINMTNDAKKCLDKAVGDYEKACKEELNRVLKEVKDSAELWFYRKYTQAQGLGKEEMKRIKDAIGKASKECNALEKELNELIQDLDID